MRGVEWVEILLVRVQRLAKQTAECSFPRTGAMGFCVILCAANNRPFCTGNETKTPNVCCHQWNYVELLANKQILQVLDKHELKSLIGQLVAKNILLYCFNLKKK